MSEKPKKISRKTEAKGKKPSVKKVKAVKKNTVEKPSLSALPAFKPAKKSNKHSGFVAIIGRPNVGKSTLLNYLVGEKLAGVSNKPQTTRNPVRGILSKPQGQIVFVDTPGLHQPQDMLGSWMMRETDKALEGVDLLYWMVLPQPPHPYEEKILNMVQKLKIPTFLLVNQTDRYSKPAILPVLEHYSAVHSFAEMIPISAKTGDQVELVLQKTFEALPLAEPFFPEDQISDQNERFIVTEIVREKLFRFTEQEVPYSTAIVIDEFKERNERLTDIQLTIVVEKDSQKAIIIGKQGEMLRQIGQQARYDIENLLKKKVFLQIWVKTVPFWKGSERALKDLGYGPTQ